MHGFKTYHPIVNFIYFVCVIGFSMLLMHPVTLLISFVGALGCVYTVKRGKSFLRAFLWATAMLLMTATINPLFSHAGASIIAYFPNGNPLTLESVFFGFGAGTALGATVLFFSAYNDIMTSDKYIYLFGKIIPSLSLAISMILRFVPDFISRLNEIIKVQKTLGNDITSGNLIKRAKNAGKMLSILVTWSLENSIQTADSMKSRGYGMGKRTSYGVFHFDKRDAAALIWIVAMAAVVIFGVFDKGLSYSYYPLLSIGEFSLLTMAEYTAYFLLCATPIIIEAREVYIWKSLR